MTIIAIDGPSGTGKSSVSRRLAAELGASYVDTGAMYRAATLAVLRAGVDLADPAAIAAATEGVVVGLSYDAVDPTVTLGGEDVTAEIRGAEVTGAVSAVSAVPAVRTRMVRRQRELGAAASLAVLEGRDIGTVVFPDADLKIFLTATADARATRRHAQDVAAGRAVDYAAVLAAVERRDHLDSTRAASPLRPAADATIIDTSDLTFDEVVEALVVLARAEIGADR